MSPDAIVPALAEPLAPPLPKHENADTSTAQVVDVVASIG